MPKGYRKDGTKVVPPGRGGQRTIRTTATEVPEPPIDTRADTKPMIGQGAKPRYQLKDFLDIAPDKARELGCPVDELEALGIDYHNGMTWQGGEFWEQHAGYTPMTHWLDEREDRRMPLDKSGKPIKRKDAVLGIKSVAEVLEQIAAEQQGLDKYSDRPQEGGNKTYSAEVPGIPRFDRARITPEMAEEAHERHLAQGLIGPTAEMSYEEVFRRKGKDRVDSEEAHYREGGFHVSRAQVPDEVNVRAREQYENARDAAISGKRTFGSLTGAADKWTRNPTRGYRGAR